MDSSVKYNFPPSNPNPFDEGYYGNYFVFANGFSNLSKDLSQFNLQSYDDNIPTGYKTIIVCHRIALIYSGHVVHEWAFKDFKSVKDEQVGGKYFITTEKPIRQFRNDWRQYVEEMSVIRPDALDASILSIAWTDLEKCKEYALGLTNSSDNKAIISVILDTISWH